MTNYILMTMLMISSMAMNAMDVPRNGRAAYLPLTSTYMLLSDDDALRKAIDLSEREEQKRQLDKQIEAKEMELAFALSTKTASNPNNNPPAQPKQYDLTNPLEVIAWAQQEQSITMTNDEAEAFANEQRGQLELQQAIDFSRKLDDTPKATAKPDTTPQAPAQIDSDSKKEADECFFCTEELDTNVIAVGPNCAHKTHSECLAEYKKKFSKCPICEATL